MVIEYHDRFIKHYVRRIRGNAPLDRACTNRLNMFFAGPKHPLLKDHALSGDMAGFRSFSVTGYVRVVYQMTDDTIQLYDIGTHAQLYS